MNVLLPVLRRPTMASFMRTSLGGVSSCSASGRRCAIELEQLVLAAILLGADADELSRAELVELGRLRIESRRVALVGDADDRLVDVAQAFGDFLVERREPARPSTTKRMTCGLIDGDLDLPFDLRR